MELASILGCRLQILTLCKSYFYLNLAVWGSGWHWSRCPSEWCAATYTFYRATLGQHAAGLKFNDPHQGLLVDFLLVSHNYIVFCDFCVQSYK